LPAFEGLTTIGRSVEYDQAPHRELSAAGARARGSCWYARHRPLSVPGKYDGQSGLLGTSAGTVQDSGIVDGYGAITYDDVLRAACTLGGRSRHA
jgi:hypothetical protein